MSYIYDLALDPRVQAVFLADGTPIPNDESTTYMVATNNFVLSGGDAYEFNVNTAG